MEKRNNYYQKVYDRFSNSRLSSNQNYSVHLSNKPISTSDLSMIDFSSTFNKSIYNSTKSKRVTKLIRKDHYESIKSYLSTLNHLQQSTLTDYAQTIVKFLCFSPNCRLEDFENYLKFKSCVSKVDHNEELKIKGNLIKHYTIVKKYLEFVHNQEIASHKVEHYKKPEDVEVYPYPLLTKEEVFWNYQQLIKHNKYEDAVLLHLMFTLGLTPYTISLLTFESLTDHKTVKYFDHKARAVTEINLTNVLQNELNYLKIYRAKLNDLSQDEERKSLDGTIIKGTFIFRDSPTNIRNKFARNFGGILSNFDITPRNMAIISRYYKRVGENNLY